MSGTGARGRSRRLMSASCAVVATLAIAGCASGRPAGPSALHAEGSAAGPASASAGLPSSSSPSRSATSASPTAPSGSARPSGKGGPSASGHPSASAAPAATPSQAAGGTTAACVTSVAKANCGPFAYSGIQRVSQNPTVGNDVWAPITGWRQTLYANDPGNWHVTATMPAGNTAVVSYPSSGSNYGNQRLSSFHSMYSSFTENMNATSKTSAWAAYDIWLNNYANEVMIQHDFANNGACGAEATATFGGSGGVPVQRWYLCQFGSELIWKLYGDEKSGSVDVLSMLTWLVQHRYLPQTSTLTLIGYGWEICSTGGEPETFNVSRYTISAS
jgi:hypothetical protein